MTSEEDLQRIKKYLEEKVPAVMAHSIIRALTTQQREIDQIQGQLESCQRIIKSLKKIRIDRNEN